MTLNSLRASAYRVLLFLSASILALNVVIILYSVFTRYVLNHAPIWSDEFSRYAIIASVMLVMSCAYVDSRHMRVSFVEQNVGQTARRLIKLYQWFVVLGVSLFFTYVSTRYSLSLSKFASMSLGVSKTIPLLSISIGFGALFAMVLMQGPFQQSQLPQDQGGSESC